MTARRASALADRDMFSSGPRKTSPIAQWSFRACRSLADRCRVISRAGTSPIGAVVISRVQEPRRFGASAWSFRACRNLADRCSGHFQLETDLADLGRVRFRSAGASPIGAEVIFSVKRTSPKSARYFVRRETGTAPIGELASSGKRAVSRSASSLPHRRTSEPVPIGKARRSRDRDTAPIGENLAAASRERRPQAVRHTALSSKQDVVLGSARDVDRAGRTGR